MKSKKLLSLLLALMMMLSVVPFYASAADPIALTASNITVFPTVSGTIYYGQTVGESLTLTGGEVQYNGEIIPGEFVHTNSSERPTGGGTVAMRASFTFNPTDTENYTGFSVRYSRDVTYMVLPTTPVYVDENSKPYIENTEVEAGTKLSDITINGSAVKNPYYPEESRFLPKTWTWANPDTIVGKSGYFDVVLKGDNKNYNNLTHSIYVDVAGSVLVPTIEVSEIVLSYDKNRTCSDINFDGTKAYVTNDDGSITEVLGTFSVPEAAKDTVVPVGEYDIPAIFTPTDTETYSTVEFTVPVKVSKSTIKFVDENGADVVPEYTIPYGATLNNYEAPIFEECKKYLNTGSENIRLYFSEEDSKTMFDAGTYDLTIGAAPYYTTSNYLRNDNLKVKVTVEPKTLNAKIGGGVDGYYVVDSSAVYHVKGTFDVYVDDVLVQSGIKYLEDKFELTFPTDVSKTYTIKIVYNPIENDNFVMDDIIYQSTVIADRNLTFKGIVANYKLGDDTLSKSIKGDETISTKEGNTVKLESISDEFAYWIITDANGNEVDLEIKTIVTNVDENGGYTWETVDGDLTSKNIVFTMPTYDIIVTQKTTSELAAENCDHLCHKDGFLSYIWQVITFLQRLFGIQQYCDCGNLHYDAPFVDLGL